MSHCMEMYTKAGDAVVFRMVTAVQNRLNKGQGRSKIVAYLTARMEKISQKHGEIYDSEVQDMITWTLREDFHRAGYTSWSAEENY